MIGIGDNVVDDYTNIRTVFPGGNALNFSVYASMLGCEAAYLGVFGTDRAAEHVRKTADELGIDTSHCKAADGLNGHAELALENGERIFLRSNEGGIAKSVPLDFVFDDIDYLESFALMHTSAYSYIDSYHERLGSFGCPLSYDFSDDFDADAALSSWESWAAIAARLRAAAGPTSSSMSAVPGSRPRAPGSSSGTRN